MSERASSPRIVLISQWPNVKNGEYELIEKIKQTGYKISVVDYFGFDVDTGEFLILATFPHHFDFAISFHYDTPKFLNIPTFLWVANPLEFMHLRGDYRTVLLHHLRAYDGYLCNGSDPLQSHIRNVVGSEWRESGLEMFPSCSRVAIIPPQVVESETAKKVFYCGVNWERGIDRVGRSQGLLIILQEMDVVDFYGPSNLEGISPWEGFTSYKGEIPFDGVSITRVMQQYGAVLAVSSPAHIKSQTSSSRVFEGIASGVPVISDENAHVKKLFGDLVYYFHGNTEEARARSIRDTLQRIHKNPEEARDRVIQAQALMAARYCFEPCFENALAVIKRDRLSRADVQTGPAKRLDVFLFHHDPAPNAPGHGLNFHNIFHVIEAAGYAAKVWGVQVPITYCGGVDVSVLAKELPIGVSWSPCHPKDLTSKNWDGLRMGEKVALLAQKIDGDFATFLTQFDYPQYDCFSKALDWFVGNPVEPGCGLHIGGFFVNDLLQKAPMDTRGIIRNNASTNLYQWTQNSLAEHQMATLFFGREAFGLLTSNQIGRFDAILPVSIIAAAIGRDMPIHRSRHILMRVQYGHFVRHYEAYRKATERGFWAQHYDLVTTYTHELNALYDVIHESREAIAIADKVSGHSLHQTPPVDPAVHIVNEFVGRLRPIYRWIKRARRAISFKTS